ncbi:MAG: AmmeMemoRadiSam system protein A [Lachnospiraceae bacterium]|nr:AmmeMemoRadiSam system protein A [Lachnospiraceae bacterium]
MSVIAAYMVPHPPMIVPSVGRGDESRVELTVRSYEKAAEEIASLKPDTIIISSPHSIMYSDYFHISPGRHAVGSFASFNAPDVSFSEDYDEELVDEICTLADKIDFPAGTLGQKDSRLDHGTMVPLYFIRKKLSSCKIVRLGLSGLPLTDHYRFGQLIKEAVDNLNRRVVYIASGDLSHKLQTYGPYGFAPEGPEYDKRIMDVCGRAAFGELFDFNEGFLSKAAECGHKSFVIMAGAFDGISVKATEYSHEDVTGVGYGICSFIPQSSDHTRHFLNTYLDKLDAELKEKREQSDEYVRLARQTIETYIKERKIISVPDSVSKELLTKKAGAFVSIHKQGALRGCIGTILPTKANIAEEIIGNAISASTTDPRFDPITPDELPWLDINVDILSEPEDISSPDMLDVKKYGVIVTSGYKRGLLLPDLDGVDSIEQQISIAMKKGGIGEHEKYSLQRFEVIRHV